MKTVLAMVTLSLLGLPELYGCGGDTISPVDAATDAAADVDDAGADVCLPAVQPCFDGGDQ